MSRYGIDFYGTGVRYGNAALVQFSAAPFYTVPKAYGTINVLWNNPSGNWTKFRLVRNKYGFPVDPDDGTLLIEKDNVSFEEYFEDSNLEQGRTYYYSIFLLPANVTDWLRAGNAYGVSVKDFNTLDRMWNYLPIVYRNTDLVISNPASGTTIYDYANSRENDDLRSLLSIFAFEYDLEKTLATNLMYSGDTTYVDGRYIAPMMQQFGLKFEPEIGLQQSRVLLRNAIKIYKNKGSYSGLITYLKSYTGWDLEIVLGKNLMLDINDSSFEQSVGAWVSSTATLAQQQSGVIAAPGGSGTLIAYNGNANLPATFPNLQEYLLKVTTTTTGTITLDCGYYPSPKATNGIPVKSANIIGVSRDGTYVTYYTTGNNFVNGDKVTVTDLSTSAFNLSNATVYSSTGYEFKVASTAAGSSQGVIATPPPDGIPASIGVAGGNYTFSIFGVSAATARTATLTIKWHDLAGNYLSTSSAGTGVSLPVAGMANGTAGQPTVSAVAPVNAAFATPCISIASATNGQIFYFDAAMFENSNSVTTFEDSRLIKITFKASRINELKNPNFTTNTQWGITNGTFVLGSSLSPAPTALSGETLVAKPTASGDVVINSENITTVLPNTTYTFSAYTKYFNATPSTANPITASIVWYNTPTISKLSISSNTVTVTTSAAHGFSAGDTITFTNTLAPFAAVTGTATVVTVPTATTLTVVISGSGTVASANTSGTIAGFIEQFGPANTGTGSITKISGNGQYATYTTSERTAIRVGSTVTISGASYSAYNISGAVTSVSENTFTINTTAQGETSTATWTSALGVVNFVRPSVTATSPSNVVYGIVKVKYPTTSTSLYLVLDEALFESSAYVNSYFDGNTGVTSLTNIMWEVSDANANAARSHYYKNRGTIQGRLMNDLPNYLTLGSQFQLLFAKP
jgi:hypothetical protein